MSDVLKRWDFGVLLFSVCYVAYEGSFRVSARGKPTSLAIRRGGRR